MAPQIFSKTVYEYVVEDLYECKGNIVRLELNFDINPPDVLLKKYHNAIRKCRKIICPSTSREIYGDQRFRKCQDGYKIPYFVLEIEFIGRNNRTYRQGILIEKETIYAVATTYGEVQKITKANRWLPIEEPGVPYDLQKVYANNVWFLLKDGGKTDVKRFRGPWFRYVDLQYQIKIPSFSCMGVFDVVVLFHEGGNNRLGFKMLSQLLQEGFGLLIYIFPESIRFHEIHANVGKVLGIEEAERFNKIPTLFHLVTDWNTFSTKIRKMNVEDTKTTHSELSEPKTEAELLKKEANAKLAKKEREDDFLQAKMKLCVLNRFKGVKAD